MALAAAASLGAAPEEATGPPAEYAVKAAFLYNFSKFVEWPPATFQRGQMLTFCVLGRDPFGTELDAAVAGRSVHGRPAAVLRLDSPAATESCHVLFVSSSERSRLEEILAALRDRAVLTVGESEGFTGTGGMINFVLRSRRVRFEINQAAAERAGLKISSRLLGLAETAAVSGRGAL